jgi:hypothetical protein
VSHTPMDSDSEELNILYADAARYRWLRNYQSDITCCFDDRSDPDTMLTDVRLDVAIDAALRRSGQEFTQPSRSPNEA